MIWRLDGTYQVAYNRQPLYVHDEEQPLVAASGLVTTGGTGNGDGVNAFGATLSLVAPKSSTAGRRSGAHVENSPRRGWRRTPGNAWSISSAR